MTANQIAYNQHLEAGRHNRVMEALSERELGTKEATSQAALEQARVAAQRQVEDARHNAEMEHQNWYSTLAVTEETARHNRAGEEVNWFNASSQRDHFTRADAIAREQLKISQHMADSQRISAQASRTSAAAAYRQSSAALQNAATNVLQVSELQRHNTAVESEQHRTNVVQETINSMKHAETMRHNKESESQGSTRNDIESVKANARGKLADLKEQELTLEKRKMDIEATRTVIQGIDRLGHLALSIYNVALNKEGNNE